LDAGRENIVTGANERTCQEGYQRNPLRCSSAISLTMASVCAPAILADSREDGIHQGNRSGVRRRRRKLIRSRPGKLRHIRAPREKDRCQRCRRNRRLECVLAGPRRWSVEVRGGNLIAITKSCLLTERTRCKNPPCRGGAKIGRPRRLI